MGIDMAKNITNEIQEHLGIIYSTIRGRKDGDGWTKEVNIVSWNGNPGKVDIRDWNEDHTRCTKGITFTKAEAEELMEILQKYFGEDGEQDGR